MEQYPIKIEVQPDAWMATVDVKALLRQGGFVALAAVATGLVGAGMALGKAVLTHSPKTPSDKQRAYELVTKALLWACQEQLVPLLEDTSESEQQRIHHQLTQVPKEVQALNIKLTPQLFSAPKEMAFLKDFLDVHEAWLIEMLNCTASEAAQLGREFPALFRKGLILEWCGASNEDYSPIQKAFEHPWQANWERDYRLFKYYAELKQLVKTPALGDEDLPLDYIYVRPDYQVLDYVRGGKPSFSDFRREDLHSFLCQRIVQTPIATRPLDQRLIILLGQPGQGKTSFCYTLINDLLKEPRFEQALYFVKLRDIEEVNDLIKKPFDTLADFLKEEHGLTEVFDKNKTLVLLLDGLDELYMTEGLTNVDLKTFYERLQTRLSKRKYWTVVLTSRHHYLSLEQQNLKGTLGIKLAPLTLAQQLDWLKLYNVRKKGVVLTAQKIKEINTDTAFEHVEELIQQPILLHMVALTRMELQKDDSRATLYKHLFDHLIQRSTEEGKARKYYRLKQHTTLFRRWLQEIAYTIYQSDHEYITYEQLMGLDHTARIQKIVETHDELPNALKDLLVAFYFKKNKQSGAVEFLHKSLQEYLTAEYFLAELQERLVSSDLEISYISVLGLFTQWFALRELSPTMRTLLVDIIEGMAEVDRSALREAMKSYFDALLAVHFALPYVANGYIKTSSQKPLQQIAFVFQAYWWILAHLQIKQNGDLLHDGSRSDFLVLIQLPYLFAPLFLSYLDLSGVDLRGADLRDTDLRDADLRGADLREAKLREADLRDTDLRDADLIGADLRDADLRDTDLRDADLRDADLSEADLSEADLRDADLRGMDLRGADLRRADLRDASASKPTFLQDLLHKECIGTKALIEQYEVDSNPLYEDWDADQQHPYYLIQKKPTP